MKWLERASLLLRGDLVLGEVFHRLARLHGARPLVEEAAGLSLTHREAAERVEALAAALAPQVGPGEPVVIAPPNSYDVLLLCAAASRAGGLPVPVNDRATPAEIDGIIADCGARVVVRDPALLLQAGQRSVHPAPRTDPAAVAAIFYTSGTTGRPKGVRLTHRALLGQIRGAAAWPTRLRRDEVVVGLPVPHIMGFATLLGLACAGIPVWFMPRFRADTALDAIEGRRATMFVGVPAMYRMMLEAGAAERDLSSVRVWMSGADVMPDHVARAFQRLGASATLPVLDVSIGGAWFVEGYGMVELGGGVAAKVASPLLPLPLPGRDLLGVPLPPFRFRVVDDHGQPVRVGQIGRLEVKGPGALEGYHGDPDATAAVLTPDGWVRTGDLVRRGPFGLVSFAGRAKDVIKHGGYSVYALEVQRVLESHPAVAEAAVVGVPDQRLGEQVAAAVRLAPGAAASEDELRTYAADRLAGYKVPAVVRIVHRLPRTGTDKVRREDLRALLS